MAPRRRRSDSVGAQVNAGCAKCCAYCRISPLGSAVCYSAIFLGVITFVLYLFGAGLSSAAEPAKGQPDGECRALGIGNATGLAFGGSNAYINYLKGTGVVVLLTVIAIMMSCCVCCGLFGSFPRSIKIAAAILLIPVTLLLALYIAWLAVGTYFTAAMTPSERSKVICRNIIAYIILLYFYLFCMVVFGIIVAIWKIHKVIKGDTKSYSKPTKSRAPEGGGDGGLVGKVGGMKTGMKVMSAVV